MHKPGTAITKVKDISQHEAQLVEIAKALWNNPYIVVDNCREVLGGEIKNVQMADGKEMFKGHEGKIVNS